MVTTPSIIGDSSVPVVVISSVWVPRIGDFYVLGGITPIFRFLILCVASRTSSKRSVSSSLRSKIRSKIARYSINFLLSIARNFLFSIVTSNTWNVLLSVARNTRNLRINVRIITFFLLFA